jgi:hypothetical protein
MPRPSRLPMWMAVLAWIAIGCGLPALAGWLYGVRDPQAHLVGDEHCYLLQADTFASGRLTNPTPRHFAFFESPHVLLTPSYQAKYQPGQGVCLAIGQRYLGHPICGVWLSCGLFAGALYWMLCAWLPRNWALIGTLHGVGVLGVTTYWAQSYWGGMVSATGGALVLGGTCWTLRRWRPIHGFWTGLGTVLLACSRPFEGGIICLACATSLVRWLWSGSMRDRRWKLLGWCGPFALVVAAGVGALATYNHAVTGSWTTMPYGVHHRQYFTCGLFRWQSLHQIPERQLTTRVRDFFEVVASPGQPGGPRTGLAPVLESAFGAVLKLPGQFFFHSRFLARSKRFFSPRRLLEYVLIGTYLISLVQSLRTTRHWGRLRAAHGLLICSALAGATVWWKLLHYRAPFVCLYYFLATDLLRRLALLCHRSWGTGPIPLHRMSVGFGFTLVGLIPITWMIWGTDLSGPEGLSGASRSSALDLGRWLTRSQLLQRLAAGPQPALAFVSYSDEVSTHEEWVYNLSNLAQQRVLLAHDMGPQKNRQLISDFSNRKLWRVMVTRAGAELQPYKDLSDDNPLP